MGLRLVGDLECDSLDPNVIWCGVFQDIETGEVFEFSPESDQQVMDIPKLLDRCDEVAFHNGISFDLYVLKKLLNYEVKCKKTDTLVLSRLLFPDRIGGHSVEAWAERLGGQQKVAHEDWSKFTPEMLHRCRTDVEIQVKIYKTLMKEMDG